MTHAEVERVLTDAIRRGHSMPAVKMWLALHSQDGAPTTMIRSRSSIRRLCDDYGGSGLRVPASGVAQTLGGAGEARRRVLLPSAVRVRDSAGRAVDLGHDPVDRSRWLGPMHRK